MNTPDILGNMAALITAVVWGTGDFMGGLATRNRSQYQVLMLASLSGLVSLLIAMFVRGEAWPALDSIWWCAAAGVSGAIGIAALYRGLASAEAALVAPTAGVVGVALPVFVSVFTAGPLRLEKWLGIASGVLGIWLVSSGSRMWKSHGKDALALAILAGLGFGGFFVLIAQVKSSSVFAPLVVAKAVAVLFALLILALRWESMPSPAENKLALVAGVFDASGNVFFLVASRLTLLGFAAVISSMAPAMTILLAALVSRQRVEALQKLGAVCCLAGIALIVA